MKLKLRFISSFLLISFFVQQISFAAEIKSEDFNLFQKPQVHIKFPESVATLEDAWTPPQYRG
jgi:hypothetical protein